MIPPDSIGETRVFPFDPGTRSDGEPENREVRVGSTSDDPSRYEMEIGPDTELALGPIDSPSPKSLELVTAITLSETARA